MSHIERSQRTIKVATPSSILTQWSKELRSQLRYSILKNRNELINRDSKLDIDKNIATNKKIATGMHHIEKSQSIIKIATQSSILAEYRIELNSQLHCQILKNRNEPHNRDFKLYWKISHGEKRNCGLNVRNRNKQPKSQPRVQKWQNIATRKIATFRSNSTKSQRTKKSQPSALYW